MAIKLSSADHLKLETLLRQVFQWHAAGKIPVHAAVGLLSHIISTVELDHRAELQSWLYDPKVRYIWRDGQSA